MISHAHFFDFLAENDYAISQLIQFLEEQMDVVNVVMTNITHDFIRREFIFHFEENNAPFCIAIGIDLFYNNPEQIYEQCCKHADDFTNVQAIVHTRVLEQFIGGTAQ